MAKIPALRCPNCNALVSRKKHRCEYCGAELVISPEGSFFSLRSLNQCPKCEAINEDSSWLCVNCRTIFTKDVEMLKTKTDKNNGVIISDLNTVFNSETIKEFNDRIKEKDNDGVKSIINTLNSFVRRINNIPLSFKLQDNNLVVRYLKIKKKK